MSFTTSDRGDVMRCANELLQSWQNTKVAHERAFLFRLNDLITALRSSVDLPGLQPGEPERYRKLLEVGASECAVLQLLTKESGYMFSRGPDGVHMATVVLAFREVEATASALSGGLALAGAILLSLTNRESAGSTELFSTASTTH